MTRAIVVPAIAVVVCGAALSRAGAQHSSAAPELKSLPLHVAEPATPAPLALAVMLSGDGGWAAIDKRIASDLAVNGLAVVGMDSRSYLMHARTPDETAADVARIIRSFGTRWAVQRVALIGYSRGADLVPFVANRLPADLRQEIALIALLAPAERASFQFHWIDLLTDTSRPSDKPILPELERLRGTPVLCVYGREEKESLCRLADTTAVHVERREGKHHFDDDYDAIATTILRMLAPLDASGR